MRVPFAVLVVAILGGTGCFFTDNHCGRTRTVSAHGTNPQARPTNNLVTVILAEGEDRRSDDPSDGISWNVPVSLRGDPILAVHLHDRNAEHDDGILYAFPMEGPEAGFIPASSAVYDYPTPMPILFAVTRAGQAYIDIHTVGQPEGTARADLTSVDFQDWSGYYCD